VPQSATRNSQKYKSDSAAFLHLNKMSFNKAEYLSLLRSYFVLWLRNVSDTQS